MALQRGQNAPSLIEAVPLTLQEGAATIGCLLLLDHCPRGQNVQLQLDPIAAGVEYYLTVSPPHICLGLQRDKPGPAALHADPVLLGEDGVGRKANVTGAPTSTR